MTLDLREVIGIPGSSADFDYEPDLTMLISESILSIGDKPRAVGSVRNSAGVISLEARVDAALECECSRCLKRFERELSSTVTALLSTSETAEDDPEYYYIEGLTLDPDEIISTEVLLSMEHKQLCREECRGLCHRCGADLNGGDCGCKPETDPRLAVLGQLLGDGETD